MRDRLLQAIRDYKTCREKLRKLDKDTEETLNNIMEMYKAAYEENMAELSQLLDILRAETSFGLLDRRLKETDKVKMLKDGFTADMWPNVGKTKEDLQNCDSLVPSEGDTK